MTAAPDVAAPAEHLLPLPGSDWSVWRAFVVRGAGMPFAWAGELDERARDPLVHEAILWQNPVAAPMILRPEGRRRHVRREVAASYLQRYTTKNDTIGFFGPVAWGTWSDGPTVVDPGEGLIRRRTVRFEHWAVAELARALDRRHDVRPWVAPVRAPSAAVVGDRVYASPTPTRLEPALDRVFALVDGKRSAREIAHELGGTEQDTYAALERLQELDAVAWELGATRHSATPERYLRGRLLRVGDPSRRDAALADLDRLEAARARVAGAAGDPAALGPALTELQRTFEELTEISATRRPGEQYAGRFIVFEETLRDIAIELDARLAEQLGPPLGLLLQSARWLTCVIEEAYHAEALAVHARLGGGPVPLAMLLDGVFGGSLTGEVTPLVATLGAELRRRWREILAPAPGERVLERSVDELAAAVARNFPADRPGWPEARNQCPDVLIAADSAEALAAGACRFVVGELHVAFNTLDIPMYVTEHDRPDALLEAVAHDLPGRIQPLYPRALCNSRTAPPTALQSPAFTYLGAVAESPTCPEGARVLPLFGLVAVVEDERVRVRSRSDDELDLPWAEVVGGYLSVTSVKAFGVLEPAPHAPRIVIGDVVVNRESWRFALDGTPLARRGRGAERQAAVREWATAEGFPRRVFVTVPGFGKPQYLDLENELSVDVAARLVRRALERELEVDLRVSEMLPGADDLWLPDAEGNRYTCELRMVCVDPEAA